MTISPKPDDHDAWWDAIDAGLADIPANIHIARDPLRCSDEFEGYRIEMTSLDRYLITAWLSVPTGDGPHPAVLLTPSYMSVVTPAPYEFRTRYVTMSLASRGQRGADKPYAAAFPGHLTEGIGHPETYVFRGVAADTIRAWEVLRGLPFVDGERCAMAGNDLALLVAARRSGAKAVHAGGSFWYRMVEAAQATGEYPLEELNDFARAFPEQWPAAMTTLSYLDPVHLADRVTARVLLERDQESTFANDAWFELLVSRFATAPAFYDRTHQGQTDYDAGDAWLAGELGVDPFPRSWQVADLGAWRR